MSARTDQTENESPPAGTDSALGVEPYFRLLRQQMDLQREFTMTWAAAVTSMSSALLGQWQTVEHIVAGHADQIAERAHGAERVTRGIARQVVIAERTLGSLTEHHPAPRLNTHREATREPFAAASAEASAEHVKVTPDIFDELLELIVDEDIKAAIP
jgi:hypothetical protein